MNARLRSLVLGLALVALGAGLYFAIRGYVAGKRGSGGELVVERTGSDIRDGDVPAVAVSRSERAAAERSATVAETKAIAGDERKLDERERGGDDDLTPTPAEPGAGQALLRVEVVALETGRPLPGAILNLSPGESEDGDEGRSWAFSRQADPARGVEGDDVTTDEAGRGEFVVETGYGYGLRGRGEHGQADRAELELAPFLDGEGRDVRLALPTAWDLDWHVRVVDGETKLPIAGANCVVEDQRGSEEREQSPTLAAGQTNGDGWLVLRLPSWESIVALFDAPGYFSGGCEVVKQARSHEAAETVELFRSAALRAGVLDLEGRPAAGVEVKLRAYEFQLVRGVYGRDRDWVATTGDDGTCAFPKLPARVELRAELRRGDRVLLRPKDPTTGVNLVLEPQEQRRIDWQLEAGCSVSGVLRDGEGEPIPDVPLILVQLSYGAQMLEVSTRMSGELRTLTERGRVRDLTATFRTDSRGRYAVDAVPAGTWALGPTEEAAELPQVMLHFAIRSEERSRELELRLDRGLHIEGVVLDPEGMPIRSAGISCVGNEPRLRSFRTEPDWSERDGRFVVGPLLAGSYLLHASPVDPSQAPSETIEAIAGTGDVQLCLRWGGALRGSVVDAASGETVESEVSVPGWRYGHRLRGSDFDFRYVPAGTYDLVAKTEDGRIGVLRSIHLGEREARDDLQVLVSEGASLTVRTAAKDGVFLRVDAAWEDIPLDTTWASKEPWRVTVPPGNVLVRWFRIGRDGVESLAHEERRFASKPGEELSIEYSAPE